MADGKKLSFMDEADLYTLFGNAIDNAIESTLKIEEEKDRTIILSVKTINSFLSIHLDNPYLGKLIFEEDIPVTTKQEKEYHGFGLKSMRLIVEKYQGNMSLSPGEERFNMNILLPITE